MFNYFWRKMAQLLLATVDSKQFKAAVVEAVGSIQYDYMALAHYNTHPGEPIAGVCIEMALYGWEFVQINSNPLCMILRRRKGYRPYTGDSCPSYVRNHGVDGVCGCPRNCFFNCLTEPIRCAKEGR